MLLDSNPIEEILGALPWLSLPHARAAVPGVLTWRARAVPVVDLAAFVPSLTVLEPSRPRLRTLIVRAGEGRLALPIDGASEVKKVSVETIRPKHVIACELADAEAELETTVMMVVEWEAVVQRLFARDEVRSGMGG
jgi:chemotaxis signal transduction protein